MALGHYAGNERESTGYVTYKGLYAAILVVIGIIASVVAFMFSMHTSQPHTGVVTRTHWADFKDTYKSDINRLNIEILTIRAYLIRDSSTREKGNFPQPTPPNFELPTYRGREPLSTQEINHGSR